MPAGQFVKKLQIMANIMSFLNALSVKKKIVCVKFSLYYIVIQSMTNYCNGDPDNA